MQKTAGPEIKLSIVFLNFNRVAETRHTCERLKALLAGRAEMEVIAVDNASCDGTGAYLDTQADWLSVVKMPNNGGIAGYNEGFKQARGRYILVLDDDSHPKDFPTLEGLIDTLDNHPEIGVVACAVENAAGETVSTWHLPADQQAGPSMAFVGCGFAIRRDLFEAIGWYPEDFFLYQNEMEVAIQVRRQGFGIHYDPRCRVVHREAAKGRTSWRRVYYPTRNTIWLIRRHFSGSPYMIFSRLCIGLFRALQAHQLGWYYKAVREAFRHPVPIEPLPRALRLELAEFRRQNSLWHQFFRLRVG
jgi:GT2 family glycosyltransferase